MLNTFYNVYSNGEFMSRAEEIFINSDVFKHSFFHNYFSNCTLLNGIMDQFYLNLEFIFMLYLLMRQI